MMRGLVLSLFPGIGLLDMAFEEAGFCVVRGPDLLWGGDIRKFNPPARRFDGIIGGPPCQIFSRMRHINPKAGQAHGNLIPEFERVTWLARPAWFVMENVPEAPEPNVPPYHISPQMIRDVWVGGETTRMRRFTFGSLLPLDFQIDTLALHNTEPMQAALAGGARRVPVAIGGSGKFKASRRVCAGDMKTQEGFSAACRAQGLPHDFDLPPFTVAAKVKAVGNGVPIAMGRAVAAAVIKAVESKHDWVRELTDASLVSRLREGAEDAGQRAWSRADVHDLGYASRLFDEAADRIEELVPKSPGGFP